MVIQFKKNPQGNTGESVTAEAFQTLKNTLTQSFMIVVTDFEGKIVEINDKFGEAFKYNLSELYRQDYWVLNSGYHAESFIRDMLNIVQKGEQWSGEVCHRAKNGAIIWLKSTMIPYLDGRGRIAGYLTISTDITEQKEMKKWQYIACHHDLTNLPNRKMLTLSIGSYISRAARKGSKLAILTLDINKFKTINDTFGHAFGDLFLKEVGNRFSSIAGLSNYVFHVSGDEFIIIFEDMVNMEEQVQSVLNLFEQSFIIEDNEFDSSISVGVSIYPDHSTDTKKLLDQSDIAMYDAKLEEGNTFKVYQPLKKQ